jgi:hypothetical protein
VGLFGPFDSQANSDVFQQNSPLPSFFTHTMASTSVWVSLPPTWKLQDVQAALNVIVVLLSTLGVFTFARFCWQSNAPKIVRNPNHTVPLSSLLSIDTLGQVFDILFLLRSRIFHRRYSKIFAQSVIVLSLSTTALLSGPIARYSTRNVYTIIPKEIMGFLANRYEPNWLNAILQWNTTIISLNQAEFPYNQLLDYLPDTHVPWVYKPEEWNNSWTMNCKYTYLTPVTLYDTGNCSTTYSEIPGLDDIIPANKYGSNIWIDRTTTIYGDMIMDALLAIGGTQYNNYDNATHIAYDITIALASVHLHNLSEQMNNSSPCYFGTGNVTSAFYTKIECNLKRLVYDPNVINIAYPDSLTPGNINNNLPSSEANIANGLIDFYDAQFIRESILNHTITVPTPQDLVRFYQAYTIGKDTKFRQPKSRVLSVRVRVVQLSIIFLIITVLLTILILFGILSYGLFILRYSNILGEMPLSKLDWILLQSIQTQYLQSSDEIPSDKAFWRHSITSRTTNTSIYTSSKRTWKRTMFENAKYNTIQFQEQDLGEGRVLLQQQQQQGRAEYL